ncbi:MAG: phosphoribosylanthranilate isomerase [Clostridiales bacterium]|nr:phosphoribosylanthranilate isomerase [Clostridiales bacterium]
MMFGTEIKICGLTRVEDIIAVNRYGADYAGFVFCKKSRRYIDSYKAGELIDFLRSDITTVGVFMDEPLDNVISAARISGVQMIQLHGHESDEYVEYVRRTLERPVIKAFKADEEGALEKALKSNADYVMIDSGAGSGRKFDWNILKGFNRDYFLAGGLDPESVGEALSMLEPFAVDVSSGVETDGLKDEEKIEKFIKAVKHGGKYA